MLFTTVLMLVVAWHNWHWGALRLLAFGVVFLTIDTAFFSANMLKIVNGGWFPLLLAVAALLVMSTWRRGRSLLLKRLESEGVSLGEFIAKVTANPPLRAEGTAVFLAASHEWVPQALLQNLKHNQVLHRRNLILRVDEDVDTSRVEANLHSEMQDLGGEFYQIVMRFGFTEYIDVPDRLRALKFDPSLDPDMLTYFIGRDKVDAAKGAATARTTERCRETSPAPNPQRPHRKHPPQKVRLKRGVLSGNFVQTLR